MTGVFAREGGGTYWFPVQASNHAEMVDTIFHFIYGISVISFALIVLLMVVFVVKYRARSKGDRAESQADHSNALEIGWSTPVLIVSVVLFYWGAVGYIDMKTPPDESYDIQVQAYKWAWQFKYPNGHADGVLHVPPDEPVRLSMRSDDVIHSLFVPAFRIKQDVVPGRRAVAWFEATQPGEYDLFCTEYCGTKHSGMVTKVIVHNSRAEFDEWLTEAGNLVAKLGPEKAGEVLFVQRGCTQCHNPAGERGIGPSPKGIWGTERRFADGTTATVDEDYIRASILEPQGQVVEGFGPVMPTFQGKLKEDQIDAIIAYIKSLK